MTKIPYMKIKISTILKNEKISKDTYLLELKYNSLVHPSQFIMIDTYPYRFLLKPFSIANFENSKLKIIYRVISDGTSWLSTLKASDEIRYLGPFGNYKKIKNLKVTKDNTIFLVAGGSGVASIISLYKYFSKFTKNIYFFYGEKDKEYIIDLKKFGINNVIYTTDNGTFGKRSNVVDVANDYIKKISADFIFLCGPKGMLKFSKNLFKGIKSFALLEEYMCCGVGVCRSCVVKIKDTKEDFVYQTVCKDGPLFELDKLVLE